MIAQESHEELLREKLRADLQQNEVQDLLHPRLGTPAHPTTEDRLQAELMKALHRYADAEKVRHQVARTLATERERLVTLEKLLVAYLPDGAMRMAQALVLGMKANLLVAEGALERGWSRGPKAKPAPDAPVVHARDSEDNESPRCGERSGAATLNPDEITCRAAACMVVKLFGEVPGSGPSSTGPALRQQACDSAAAACPRTDGERSAGTGTSSKAPEGG